MGVPDQSLQEAPEQERFFEVPAMNVQYFVGRKHLLEQIDGYLQKDEKGEDRTKVVILRGLGGTFLEY